MLRTYLLALTAYATLLVVDIGETPIHGDSTERTLLLTLAATYTSHRAGGLGGRTLVLVDTPYIDTTSLRTLLADLDDMARANP